MEIKSDIKDTINPFLEEYRINMELLNKNFLLNVKKNFFSNFLIFRKREKLVDPSTEKRRKLITVLLHAVALKYHVVEKNKINIF